MAAVKGMPVPAPDDIPEGMIAQDAEDGSEARPSSADIQASSMSNLTVPLSSRSQSSQSDFSANPPTSLSSHPLASSSNTGSALLRGRAKTLAALTTTSSRNSTPAELLPRETALPGNPYINGQALEAYLYKDACECPICFLYYPPYLNRTRCCDQPICSECFVQIKRPEPHPPEHSDPTAPSNMAMEEAESEEVDQDAALVSEPAACPFCVQPEFGVTFEPPPFRRGLIYVNQASTHLSANSASAMSSSSSLNSTARDTNQPISTSRRRATSLSANASTVITTDRIRPDWASKLSTARAHAARRSAAATALHTAAYLMNNRNGLADQRGFAYFGRRGLLRRGGGTDSPTGGPSVAQLNMLSLMSERYAASGGTQAELEPNSLESIPAIVGPPRDSSRRSRMQDLEDMMLMEAIRLSLLSEEDRQRREEKEAKREGKKKSKDDKKAERKARKAGTYSSSTNTSAATLESPRSGTFSVNNGKGKEVQREGIGQTSSPGLPTAHMSRMATPVESLVEGTQELLDQGKAQLKPAESIQSPPGLVGATYKPSHLRNLSNVSSSASSSAVSLQGSNKVASQSSLDLSPNTSGIDITAVKQPPSLTPPRTNVTNETIFNFNSLAAMVDRAERAHEHSNAELDEATGCNEPELLRHELKSMDQSIAVEGSRGTELGGAPIPSVKSNTDEGGKIAD